MKKLLVFILLFMSLPCYALTAKEILNNLNQMNEQTYEVCKQGNCNQQFKTFYIELQNKILELQKTKDWGLIEVEPYVFKMFPETPLLYYQYNDWVGISISNKYLYKRYKNYLQGEWKEYLKMFSDDKYMLFTYGYNLSKREKQLQINKCKTFLKKYPNFILNKEIEFIIEDIHTHEDQ